VLPFSSVAVIGISQGFKSPMAPYVIFEELSDKFARLQKAP